MLKKTKWDRLSQREKSELMKIYYSNGISSPLKMKAHYNRFADGGPEDKSDLSFKEKLKRGATKLLGQWLYDTEVPDVNPGTRDPRELAEKVIAPFRPFWTGTVGRFDRPVTDPLSEAFWARYLTNPDTTTVSRLPDYLKEDIKNLVEENLTDPSSGKAESFFIDLYDNRDNGYRERFKNPWELANSFYSGNPVTISEYHVYPEYRRTGELTPASALGNFSIRPIEGGKKVVVSDRYDFTPNNDKVTVGGTLGKALDKVFYPFPVQDTVELSTPIRAYKDGGFKDLSTAEKNQIKHQTPVVKAIADYFLDKYPPRNYVERPEYTLPFNKERLAAISGTSYVESYLSPYTNQKDNFKEAIEPHEWKKNSLGSGLLQHSGNRKEALVAYNEAHPENSMLQNNLEYIDHEYHLRPGKGTPWLKRGQPLSGQEARQAFERISSSEELDRAVDLFNDHFVAPAKDSAKRQKRKEAGRYIYDTMLDSIMADNIRRHWVENAARMSTFLGKSKK